jgi:hypothetical protein
LALRKTEDKVREQNWDTEKPHKRSEESLTVMVCHFKILKVKPATASYLVLALSSEVSRLKVNQEDTRRLKEPQESVLI